MQGNERRRLGLRRRIVERWTPLFDDESGNEALTVEEFAAACGWADMVADGTVGADEEPLGLAGLRLSTIFPRHLLRVRDDGRLVPVSLDDAVALVRIAARGRDRVPGGGRHAATVDASDEPADADRAPGEQAAGGRTWRRFGRTSD